MTDNTELRDLEEALKTLEAQRSLLGDAVVETTLSALRAKLAVLEEERKDSAAQLRKYVTVLFADVSGFTSICRTNDAESVTWAINTLWKALDAVIIDHGGTVDKHIGDCVMAVWGLEGVREDDSVRAVEAALAMQRAADILSRDSDGQIPPLKIRIGIHSGPAFISAVGVNDEYTAMGDTVNVASRLQSHAPLGSVVVSRDTWKNIRSDFNLVQQPAVKVKGIEEELDVFLVAGTPLRQLSRLETKVLGRETIMVGRERELETLLGIFNRVTSIPTSTEMVTVIGEAGIGKSRLLHEFRVAVEKDWRDTVFFNARCTPGMVDIPCSVFRDILRYSFEVREDDPSAVAFGKLENGMGSVLDIQEIHLACNFAGFDMSSSEFIQFTGGDFSLASAGRASLVKYFKLTAEAGRTLVYLEDLHWADSVSLELVEQIVSEIPESQLMVLCLARPPLKARMPDWGDGLPNTFIYLEPLSSGDTRFLVEEILEQVQNLPDELTELIVSNADGNPFYVEELIKMLIEDGVVSPVDWTVNMEVFTCEKIPSTLTGVLQARLDTLPSAEKTLLQIASVIGRVFWDKTVKDLYGDQSPQGIPIPDMLSSVEHHDLVQRMRKSVFSNAEEFLFKHAILRDVTYETVLLSVRKKYHRLIAVWLEKNGGERVAEFASLIADHFEGGEDWENAAAWLIRSGKSAMATSAYTEALSRFKRALAIPEEMAGISSHARLHLDCGSCLEKLSRYPEAESELNTALSMAESLPGVAAESLLAKAWIAVLKGEHEKAEEFSQRAYRKAQESEDSAILARAYMRLADFEEDKNYEKVISYYRKAHSIYTELESESGLAIALLNMGNVALAFNRDDEAENFYLESLSLYKKTGNRWGIANCLGNLGCVSSTLEEFEKAVQYYRKSLEMSVQIGDKEGEVICNLNLGQSALSLKSPEKALQYLKVSLRLARAVGLVPLALEVLKFMSEAYAVMEETARAVLILMVLEKDRRLPEHEIAGIAKMLSDLMESVSMEQFEQIRRRAVSYEFETICSDLLRD